MKKYKYQVTHLLFSSRAEDIRKILDGMSEEGWRLQSTIRQEPHDTFLIFEKEIES
jgi:hypothetical protein